MLDVQNLCKSFGKKPYLTNLTFQVEGGECLALLGKNGAGKTLLLNILATLLEPTSGTVSIAGYDAFSNLKQVRPRIGYVPVGFEGYPELTVAEYLDFFAAAYRLERNNRASAINAVLDLMDIGSLRDVKIGALSTGQRQRLLFAKTFLHEPALWLLDEPLMPLDARGQIEMLELLNELRAMGTTVVIATNRIDDVPRICDKVGILNEGQFAVFNTLSQLEQEFGNKTESPDFITLVSNLFFEITEHAPSGYSM